MIIAFSGTQRGMTAAQKQTVADLIAQHSPNVVVHGDCVGADEEFHQLVRQYEADAGLVWHPRYVLRPGTDLRGASPKRAHCDTKFPDFYGIVHPPEPYLKRNEKIAADGDVLIAAPSGFKEEQKGSGTWATVRAMAKLAKSIQIVYPDGRVGAYTRSIK